VQLNKLTDNFDQFIRILFKPLNLNLTEPYTI